MDDVLDKRYLRFLKKHDLKCEFEEATVISDKWRIIVEAYKEMSPYIIEASKRNKSFGINPYFLNWGLIFSPIETVAWNFIRSHCIALYPQYPINNCFIDFANPFLKIGVELDGKDYHDEDKDLIRDNKLSRLEWRIFRIKGFECTGKFPIPDDLFNADRDIQSQWFNNSCEGVIMAIYLKYFRPPEVYEDFDYIIYNTLNKHRLSNFDL